jgi:hypothetical protein
VIQDAAAVLEDWGIGHERQARLRAAGALQ